MSLSEVVVKVPVVLRATLADKLIDLILNSPRGDQLPSDLAKTILFYWQRDQLPTETGLQRLLEASMIVSPSDTLKLFEDLGLSEAIPLLAQLKA
ncbi:MAG: hypothetical protein QXE22_02525 [Candidatus Bathyarchaeia archaeon]